MSQQETQDVLQFAARQALLNEMSFEITLAVTEEDVFRLAAQYTSRIFESDRAGVALLTPDRERLEAFAMVGEGGRIPLGIRVLTAGTVVAAAIQQRRLIVTQDMAESAYTDVRVLAEAGLRSCMNMPLITGGQVIGTLNIASKRLAAFSDKDEKLVQHMAGILAANIQNRRLVSMLTDSLKQSERLLLNVLPASIAERMKQGARVIAERFSEVTVLFADLVGFTPLAASMAPEDLVQILDDLFSTFDRLAARFAVEKIKTIGDCYMAVCGVPSPRADHGHAIAQLAIGMRDAIAAYRTTTGRPIEIRIGIHTGPVVAGVIGQQKFAYDLWGDTVNTASRMESSGVAGSIHCTFEVQQLLAGAYRFADRGRIEVKGKGQMRTYLLDSLLPPQSTQDASEHA